MRFVATSVLSLALLALLVAGPGCSSGEESTPIDDHGHDHEDADHSHTATGTVTETMDAGGYTYVQLDTPSGAIWAAGPVTQVEVGQELSVSTQMPMKGFRSETLDRTFDTLYFVNTLSGEGGGGPEKEMASGQAMGHGNRKAAPPEDVDLSGIQKADYTVAGLYENKAQLADQKVAVRGKVVKFLTGIMGTNWVHLRDGSGAAGTNDLTVTTDATVQVGDTVLVEGEVTLDKDFGAGYRYEVIIEQAEVTVEGPQASESR